VPDAGTFGSFWFSRADRVGPPRAPSFKNVTYITEGIGPPGLARPTLPRRHRRSNEMESFRQALGAIYVALADAASGEQVLQDANSILTAAVDTGTVDDPCARAALRALVHSTSLTLDEGICGVTNRNGLLRN
jgi:hypothetical protein